MGHAVLHRSVFMRVHVCTVVVHTCIMAFMPCTYTRTCQECIFMIGFIRSSFYVYAHARNCSHAQLSHFARTPLLLASLNLLSFFSHSGRQLHEVLPVTSGNRCGLIVWARSVEGVRQGICPCCWINGRDAIDSACICGPSWN
jgi:hypothetical protein